MPRCIDQLLQMAFATSRQYLDEPVREVDGEAGGEQRDEEPEEDGHQASVPLHHGFRQRCEYLHRDPVSAPDGISDPDPALNLELIRIQLPMGTLMGIQILCIEL